MKLFNPNEFSNLALEIKLNSAEIVNDIQNYTLSFIQEKNTTVEWNMYLPMFVPAFYEFLLRTSKIPTQIEYYKNYLNINTIFFSENNFNHEIINAIKARVYRTYPSLVRDIHFTKFLSENLTNSSVIYNQSLDIKEGIDLLIINNNKYYAINLFTETNRAFHGRQKKTLRHTNYTNIKYIDVPVDFKGSVKCGDFFLYGEREMKIIINKLLKNR